MYGVGMVDRMGMYEIKRGCSSAGRAPDLHSGGHRFDPVQLHQNGTGDGPVAQLVEHTPDKGGVDSSSLSRPTITKNIRNQ